MASENFPENQLPGRMNKEEKFNRRSAVLSCLFN